MEQETQQKESGQSNENTLIQEGEKTLSQRVKETPYEKPRKGAFVMFLQKPPRGTKATEKGKQ
jgi:hypothetical protein